MNTYDPLRSPDPEEWLALDEQYRTIIIERYHKKARIAMPNTVVHAGMHTIVENQLAEGTPGVQEALSRLIAEGLDRHDAVHAIASLVAGQVWRAMRGEAQDNMSERYQQDLHNLTAKKWLESAE
jgi:hypothetical protein